ncbi:phosphatidate cytidylyltransferase [Ferruginibacter lapsinanis]|uniref:phosphatidate cytidylyltransferase n=1 Tax=Ferruginibacter lapsinanis TaxID=563172 RepID=UPI001E4B665C|nr:phosphatidate cytidylyltransferase [Ferruginibacter lapsinanis]UEG51018.1 phosphatidate cytidylyltransferase [Ferruginibacter lapsinanis]
MALNIDTLKTRSLTAVVFVAVMLAGLLWNFWSFLVLFSIIHIGCWYEFIKLHELITNKKNSIYLYLGIVYISLPIILMMLLGMQWKSTVSTEASQSNYTYLFPCAIIFSIWINDTMAYIVGSLIGKTPFSKISPKKTWEGTIGGVLLCVVVIALLGFYIPVAKIISVQHWIAIAAICAIFGTAGDLLESKLKRMANVKDSGSIMPGHGGFLDRFDSMLVATPFVWLYVQLFI